jgi:hypothetical protein
VAAAVEEGAAAVATDPRTGGLRITLFTADQASQLAGELTPLVRSLVGIQRDLDQLDVRMDALRMALAGASADNPDAFELAGLAERRRALTARMGEGIAQIHRQGILVKDLDRGLLDFYALDGDRLVFLCWALGEPAVTHWHTLDGGFAGRQPIERPGRE